MRRTVIAAALLVGLAAGCSYKAKTKSYYQLGPDRAAATFASATGGVRLGVGRFEVEAPYDGERLMKRIAGNVLQPYEDHRWAASPARLVARAVEEMLVGNGVAMVERRQQKTEYDAIVRGRVLTLEEFVTDGVAHVRLALNVSVADATGVSRWTKRIGGERRVDSDDVADVAAALNEVLIEQLRGVRDEIVQQATSMRSAAR